MNTECLSNEDPRDLAVLGQTPFLSSVVPAALCTHRAVSGKGSLHKCFWRMFALSCSRLDLMFETASAWCASCYWQLVLQLCCHEAGLMMLRCSWWQVGMSRTEVESDYRTRSGPQQFKSRKFVGLSLPGKPLKYKCSWISVHSGLQTAFISRNVRQGQASYWCHVGPNKTQHWRGMKCHMELINITHQKI